MAPADTDLQQQIARTRTATERLLTTLAELAEPAGARPSLCAGWTVGHVLTHLARNADGFRRSLEGARRGEQVPPYDSMASRAADIEAGAGRPLADLVADVRTSAQRLDETWGGLARAAWDREFPHRRGPRPVRDMPTMRWSEIEVHHVDLDAGYRPRDWSPPFVAFLLRSSADTLADRLPAGAAVRLRPSDTSESWSAGPRKAAPVEVSGPSWALAGWLIGRAAPVRADLAVTGGDLPELAPWR